MNINLSLKESFFVWIYYIYERNVIRPLAENTEVKKIKAENTI